MTEAQRGEQRRRQSKAKRRRVSLSMKVFSNSFQSGGEQVFGLLGCVRGEGFVQSDWFDLPLLLKSLACFFLTEISSWLHGRFVSSGRTELVGRGGR